MFFQVLAKSCKPIPVMAFGFFFVGKKYGWRKFVYVSAIVVGVMLFLYKDKKSKQESGQYGLGELLLLASLAMDGTTTAIQDHMKKHYRSSALSKMFYMNFYSTIYLT